MRPVQKPAAINLKRAAINHGRDGSIVEIGTKTNSKLPKHLIRKSELDVCDSHKFSSLRRIINLTRIMTTQTPAIWLWTWKRPRRHLIPTNIRTWAPHLDTPSTEK